MGGNLLKPGVKLEKNWNVSGRRYSKITTT
jgi:hypothetical protein